MKRIEYFDFRRLNLFLVVTEALLVIYLVSAPFLPSAWWWVSHVNNRPNLNAVQVSKNSAPTSAPISSGYWLDIPRLDLHQQIYTGPSEYEVNKGVWHIWGTSTPDQGSNTVMAGHRFTYTNPKGVFYFLDKLQLNDRITVDWSGSEYTYRVSTIQTVQPTDVAIQDPTADSRLTLYTCTPLWSAKDRLVVTATLVSKRSA